MAGGGRHFPVQSYERSAGLFVRRINMRLKTVKSPWLERVVIVILSYLSVLSFARVISLNGDGNVYYGGIYFGYNLSSVLLFSFTAWLLCRYFRLRDRRLKTVSTIGGILLGTAIVYGGYAHYVNDIFRSVPETILQFFLIMGIGACTTPICAELLQLPGRVQKWYADKQIAQPTGRFYVFMNGHKRLYFLFVWGILMLSYMPVFLSQWPGNFVFDAKYQLSEVVNNSYHTHHPLLHTLLMGKAYQFGEQIGNVSVGYQFYTLIQMLILTGSFAYFLQYLFKKGVPRCIRIGALLWFAVFPMHSVFAISATKDVLCAAFFLYYAVFLFRLLLDGEKFSWYSYAGMVLAGILLSLLRNNAKYAVAVSGVIVLLYLKPLKSKMYFLIALAAILLLHSGCNRILIAYTHADSRDTQREMMSVPLQCMARVACYRGAELDPALYGEVCMYMQEEDIPNYNPYLADAVKNNANELLLKNNKLNFFKLWAKIGLQFPGEYLESIITNTMGYWYPLNQGMYVSADIALYHTLIGTEHEIEKEDYFPLATRYYNYLFYHLNYRSVPIMGYLFRNAPYVWLVVLTLLWSIYQKRYSLLLWGMLPLMYLGTCFLGPMAALRYIYCLVVCVPLILHGLLHPYTKYTDGYNNLPSNPTHERQAS